MSNTYILKNEELTAIFSAHGAELISVRRGGCEYIWQGDPTYWKGKAPMLFPICGRLYKGQYTYGGTVYELPNHGFMRNSEFLMTELCDDRICFMLEANAATRAVYPFAFRLTVTHLLQGARILTQVTIANTGKNGILPAAFGAHPGFNIPLDGNGAFEDYYLEFGEVCSPDLIEQSDAGFLTGRRRAYPLIDGKRINLRHSLFDIDSTFLSRVADSITLKSDRTERRVTLSYPDMPYLGIWHAPRTDAPYLCIEPWCGLPAFDGEVDDLAHKHDMFRILPGSEKTVAFSIAFE